ncbi:hypothetical protein THOM_0040, partial [Trachipleistophora hominis]
VLEEMLDRVFSEQYITSMHNFVLTLDSYMLKVVGEKIMELLIKI